MPGRSSKQSNSMTGSRAKGGKSGGSMKKKGKKGY